MNRRNKEFADLYYDVWRSGGNLDRVDRDRFDDDYDGRYDFICDDDILNRELKRQKHSKENNEPTLD